MGFNSAFKGLSDFVSTMYIRRYIKLRDSNDVVQRGEWYTEHSLKFWAQLIPEAAEFLIRFACLPEDVYAYFQY